MMFVKTTGVALFLVGLSLLQGCASTEVTAFKDPDFASTRFSKIAVFANTSELDSRQALEDSMALAINELGGNAVPLMTILPPTRTPSASELGQALLDNRIDGIVKVDISGSGVEEQWVPQTGSTTTTSGTASVHGNTGMYSGTSTTTNHGGYNVSKPWANMSTTFIDFESGRNVWIASSRSGGNAFADFDDVRKSYCKKIAEEMAAAQLW